MKYILGTKIGMVQLYDVNGRAIPSTIVHCEPNQVLEVKSLDKHGVNGVKVGYFSTKENKTNKAHAGIFKKAGANLAREIRSFTDIDGSYNVGDLIKVDFFNVGEYVDVQGISKGHGFTGAIKRWNFKIGPLSHGAGYPHRYQGSIAMGRGGSQKQGVYKGKKMHGHWGHETVSVQNLSVVAVMPSDNLIIISGAIPGPEGSIVTIKSSYKFVGKTVSYNLITKKIQEQILEANEKLEDKALLYEANEVAEEQVEAVEEAKTEIKEAAAAEAHHEKLIAEENK